MTAKELFKYLTDEAGLDETTAAAVMKAAENEKVAAKAQTLKQSSEYDALNARAEAMRVSLEGDGKTSQGAKAYQAWYEKNFAAIEKLQADAARYKERYGDLDTPIVPDPAKPAVGLKKEDVATIVNEVVQGTYGTQWSNLITGAGTVLEKHLRAQRKNSIDWGKLGEIAAKKGGDLTAAYDEWDAPERDAASKAATDAEVERRVKEEMKKRNTPANFPAGADAGVSTGISPLSRGAAEKKYDRSKVIEAAFTGKYEKEEGAAA